MYTKEQRDHILHIVNTAEGLTLKDRIENSLPLLEHEGYVNIHISTIYRWLQAKPLGPRNAQAARTAIARAEQSVIDQVHQLIIDNSGFISTRKIAAELAISKSSVSNMIRKHLNMRPFKFIRGQELLPAHYTERKNFCEIMRQKFQLDPFWYRKIIFTDESYVEIEPPHNP